MHVLQPLIFNAFRKLQLYVYIVIFWPKQCDGGLRDYLHNSFTLVLYISDLSARAVCCLEGLHCCKFSYFVNTCAHLLKNHIL